MFFCLFSPVVWLESVPFQASVVASVEATSVFCSPSAVAEFVAAAGVEAVEDDVEDWLASDLPAVEVGSAVLACHLFLELEF